jgi:hypothetical protein
MVYYTNYTLLRLESKKSKKKEVASTDEDSSQKAQNRRAQVRKAQLQHRQRKANYVEQLETDIDNLNKNIQNVKLEAQNLEEENHVMRQSISRVSTPMYPTFNLPPQDPSALSYGMAPAQGYTMGSTASDSWDMSTFQGAHDPNAYAGAVDPDFQDLSYPSGPWYPDDTGADEYGADEYVGEEDDDEEDPTLGLSSGYGSYFDDPSYYSGGPSAGPSGGHM